jgi:hypothetical protein
MPISPSIGVVRAVQMLCRSEKLHGVDEIYFYRRDRKIHSLPGG